MLKLLRKKKVTKRIYWGLAILVIPAFVIWGSSSVINKSKIQNCAGILFGEKISYEDFRSALAAWKMQMKIQLGEAADQTIQSNFNPVQAAWSRLILLHEAKKRKIRIKDQDVIDWITHMPAFEKNGLFDTQSYGIFLQYYLGVPARQFEEVMRQNISLVQVYKKITDKIAVADSEVKQEYTRQNEQTRVKYVYFPADTEKNKITVSDENIQAYYEKSKERFKVPPQINVVYVGSDIKENASQEEKASLVKKINDVLTDAKKEGFEKAAEKEKLEIKETGLFRLEDPIPLLGWFPDLSTLLFDLPQGDLSKVVELKRGVYLFKVKEKKQAYIPEFKEAKEKAKEALALEKSKEDSRQKAEEFLSNINTKKIAFEKAAQEAGFTIKETPLFSIDAYIPELGMAQPLKEAAFKLAKDAVAETVIALEQGFYVIKNLETQSANEEKFKKEKEEFTKQLLEQKRNKVFNDFFEDLRKKANLISYIDETKVK